MRGSVVMLGLATVLMVGTACASSGSGGQSRGRGDITAEELATVTAGNLLEAVRLLRPQWLRSRAAPTPRDPDPKPRVILDGTPRGPSGDLAFINTRNVESVSFLSSSDATTRYGTGYTAGAIVVRTRRR